jgi:beta-1,4-mannooligosaccharide phosphorylase
MLRSITISTRNVNSSLAKSTTKDARLRWLNGAYSWPNPRLESRLVAPNAYRDASVPILPDKARDGAIYRSPDPVLVPKGLFEREGTVANVVFPSGIDRRDDLGAPERFDVYYGMADYRIGVARLDVPAMLPRGAAAYRSQQEANEAIRCCNSLDAPELDVSGLRRVRDKHRDACG